MSYIIFSLKNKMRRKKKTVADKIQALEEVKKENYAKKLKSYKDFNERRLQIMSEFLKKPTNHKNELSL